jgi:hypothetical protein
MAQVSGYTSGSGTATDLLNQFGASGTLQQGLPQVPHYSDAARDQALSNPYYTEDPDAVANRNRLDQAVGSQSATDPTVQLIQNRALSTQSWTFGSTNQLVTSIQRQLANNPQPPEGCSLVPYCAEPGGSGTTATCQLTQSVEQVQCRETYTIQPGPMGTQSLAFTDGCAEYKHPPWFERRAICEDPVDQPRSAPILSLQTRTLCVDHFLYMRIAQDPTTNDLLYQVLDTGPNGESQKNCGGTTDYGGWHTLSQFSWTSPDSPTFTLAGAGAGCTSNTLTIQGVGSQALLLTCGASGAQNPTVEWGSPTTVTEDCWNRQRAFTNLTTDSSTCGPLEAQGCTPADQTCLTPECTSVERTYTCSQSTSCGRWEQQVICNTCIPDPPNPPRCISTATPPNPDFGIAAATMEGQTLIAAHSDSTPTTVYAFPGEAERCTRTLLVNCCNGGQEQAANIQRAISAAQMAMSAYRLGAMAADAAELIATGTEVGEAIASAAYDSLMSSLEAFVSLGFSTVLLVLAVAMMVISYLLQCDQSSTQAAIKRNLRLCAEVGDYCAQKVLFVCLKEATGYCCFGNLLARIIQVQGRAQLGLGWGSPKHPDCRGLTVEELQRIDWKAIDWSEYLEDLQNRLAWPTPQEIQTRQGTVTHTDFQGEAARAIQEAGSLGDRIRAAIAPPGGSQTTPPPSTTLVVTIAGGGSVTVLPGGATCTAGTCQLPVPTSLPLTVTATPTTGWGFSGWTGPCQGAGTCSLTLRGQTSLGATFAQTAFTLSVSIAGTGQVTSSPAGIACTGGTCSASYPGGTSVTLTAVPSGTGSFTGWSGPCGGTGPCTLAMTADQSVSALFFNRATIVSLTPTVSFPVTVGTPITWTVATQGGTPPLQYEFLREDSGGTVPVQRYGPSATYTWTPTAEDVGDHAMQVMVRSAGSPAPYDDWVTSDPFTIAP